MMMMMTTMTSKTGMGSRVSQKKKKKYGTENKFMSTHKKLCGCVWVLWPGRGESGAGGSGM
jgi:hypothetical protein